MQLENPVEQHKKAAERQNTTAGAAVITLSTSRSAGNDTSGDLIQQLLESAGHRVLMRTLIPDDRGRLRAALRSAVRDPAVNLIITTGGTGMSDSDVTVETVRGMLDKELQAFNALFAQLSYAEVKSAAILSRALAGTLRSKPIFCLPGSPRACRLAMEALIIPELPHMLLLTRPRDSAHRRSQPN